jgi:hypothetical protein
MSAHHIILDHQHREARFSATTMPRLEFRQALFHCLSNDWHRRLYPAALLVSTTAHAPDGRVLAVEHQAMRFSLLYDASWPEPHFRRIRAWPYKPLAIRPTVEVLGWIVELRLRDLRLAEGERVELLLRG